MIHENIDTPIISLDNTLTVWDNDAFTVITKVTVLRTKVLRGRLELFCKIIEIFALGSCFGRG